MKRKLISIHSILVIVLAVMMVVGIGNLSTEASFPVEVEDDLGQNITLEEKPEKIITMAPSMTEMVFAIGLGDKVVGVTDYADYPEEALEKDKIGDVTEPSIETIVAMEPDLVLAAGVNKKETIEKLQDLDITVAGFDPSNLKETIEVINKVGELTGERVQASETAAEMSREMNEIENLVEEKLEEKERPTVFYEIWNDPLTTASEGTFIHDLIVIAGGENIGAEAEGSYPQYSLEKLLEKDPEVFISSEHSASEEVSAESIKDRNNFSALQAVQNDRVYVVDQDIVSRPSPRLVDGLKAFTAAIFPELKEELEDI
ncbi:MAG: ABC transporter substrate-binding protein [Halanaerobiales bacterium]